MKVITILLLYITLYSCATRNPLVQKNSTLNQDSKELMSSCDKGDGLACSKLAYSYKKSGDITKAIEFNKKGCDLKEQSACFNLENLEVINKYDQAVSAKVQFYGQESCRCYKRKQPNLPSTSRFSGKDTIISYKVSFIIDNQGNPTDIKINVLNGKNEYFEQCAKEMFKIARFTPPTEADKKKHEFQFDVSLRE